MIDIVDALKIMVGDIRALEAKRTMHEVVFVCEINKNGFPKISFWNQPGEYILNEVVKIGYKITTNSLISKLKGNETDQYAALSFLKNAKDLGCNLPYKIVEKIKEFPEDYLEKLRNKMISADSAR